MPRDEFVFKQSRTAVPDDFFVDHFATYNTKLSAPGIDFNDPTALNENMEMARNISGTMRFKEPEMGVGTHAYGDKFQDILTEERRTKELTTKGTELFQKQENKRLLLGARKEYDDRVSKFYMDLSKEDSVKVPLRKKDRVDDIYELLRLNDKKFDLKVIKLFTSDKAADQFEALDLLVEEFVNQDFSFDFSSDQSFARESLRMEQVRKRSERFVYLLNRNQDYWGALSQPSKAAVMKKLSQASHLMTYFNARRELLLNGHYSTHLTGEMSYYNFDDKDANKALVNAHVKVLMENAERAYEQLKHMDDEDSDAQVELALRQKLSDEENYDSVAVRKEKSKKGKSQGFHWLDLFGAPLNFVSWLMRGKRTKDHGRAKFADMSETYEKYPESMKFIGKQEHTYLPARTGVTTSAPRIDLTPLFKDELKLDISRMLDDNDGLRMRFTDDKKIVDENDSHDLFETFTSAAQKYASIGGIVNADTTEMEMAFLDKMLEVREAYTARFGTAQDASDQVKARLDVINDIMDKIVSMRSGSLKDVAEPSSYDSALRNSQAVVQDTSFTENLDESNIKDIPLFTHYPNINDIKQSTIGDCYLVGAMTSFVKTSPKAVLNMFQDLGDGNVMVRLFQGYDKEDKPLDTDAKWFSAKPSSVNFKPVYVKLRKHYETGDGNANDCAWPQLLEKAYAVCGFNMKGEAYVDSKGYLHNLEKELTLGNGFVALAHLTGQINEYHSTVKAPTTAQQDQELKNDYIQKMTSDKYLGRLGAGIPKYIMDRLEMQFTGNMLEDMNHEMLVYNFNTITRQTMRDFESLILQIKKNYITNGMESSDYVPVIEKLASSIGLRLLPGWDDNTEGIFDPAMEVTFLDKFGKNFNDIRKGRDVTYDTRNGLDTDTFGFDTVNEFLQGLAEAGQTPAEGFKETHSVQLMTSIIDEKLGFSGSEQQKKAKIKQHADSQKAYWRSEDNKKLAAHHLSRIMLDTHKNTTEYVIDFLADLKEALDAGGSIEVSINHFISAIGMEYKDGTYYVLIKDPFNVYNMSYEQHEGIEDKKEDSFLDVLSLDGHKIKRHLDSDGNDERSVYGGFRGLSYWKAEDLCAKMKNYTIVKPGGTMI